MKAWNLLPTISAPMPFQMALDEILFRQSEIASASSGMPPRNDVPAGTAKSAVIASEAKFANDRRNPSGRISPVAGGQSPILRFYFSSEPWITVGYSHPPQEIEKMKNANVCKRITGGGVVHHGNDLLFSLIARKTEAESFKSVRLAYLKIHEAVKAALESFGLVPRFYRCDEELPRGKECFLFPIATDLAVNGKKIAGGAQKRSSGALLHQESLQKISGVDPFDFAKQIQAGFEKVFQIKIEPVDLEPQLLEEAEQLAEEKYERIPRCEKRILSSPHDFRRGSPTEAFGDDASRQIASLPPVARNDEAS